VLAQLTTGLDGRVHCEACGAFSAKLERGEGQPQLSAVPPLQDLGGPEDGGWAGRPLRLRRGSREFTLRDLDRLRRLVVERKAAGSDLVSTDGVRWVPVASLAALQPYLAVVRLLDSAPTTGGGGVLVEATAAEDGWGEGEPAREHGAESPASAAGGIEESPPIEGSTEPS
jgi:hypothetical protein